MDKDKDDRFFLCGCSLDSHKNYSYSLVEKDGTVTSKRFDSEGYQVCPEHGMRIYGWKSNFETGIQGNQIIDYSKMSTRKYNFLPSQLKDQRDNRDPQEIGDKILAKQNGGT